MSSDFRSFLSTPLLATAVLAGGLSVLFGLVGQVMRISQVSGWELLLQGAFFGGLLSVLVGLGWSVRALWRYATGKDRETKSV
jgi:hypothetical protein